MSSLKISNCSNPYHYYHYKLGRLPQFRLAVALRSINVRSPVAAQRALAVVEQAIKEVSNFRGEVGAFLRNILRTAQSNIRTQFINLSDAESSLRDTDFTTEVSTLVSEQVRQNVSSTILELANQNALAILNLLQNTGNGISLV